MVFICRNNPTEQAVQSREAAFRALQDEKEALKARVQLLEEGQNKDLTLLVGQKMEEGCSSREFKGKGFNYEIVVSNET